MDLAAEIQHVGKVHLGSEEEADEKKKVLTVKGKILWMEFSFKKYLDVNYFQLAVNLN